MDELISSKSKIAKNTVMLYIRMFVMMAVTLFTSREILRILGASDYGIYNVVGGFVSMLAFLRSAFVDGVQRFTAVSIGQKDNYRLHAVFNDAIIIFIILALILFIIGETVGLWFVSNKLTIADERLFAAKWVFHFSLLSLFFTFLTIPYNANIIAHECMDFYAYISVIEAIIRLLIVYLLVISSIDKLIFYAGLHFLVTALIFFAYRYYCRKKFAECIFKKKFDKPLFKEMCPYIGWHMVGNLGFSFKDQASNIVMNLFLGTAINAARGLAAQVNGAVNMFSNNLNMAIIPPITKAYASGDIIKSKSLVYTGARISTYLMAIIAIPIIINIDYILDIWLDEVPEYTSAFVIITIVASIFYSMTKTASAAIQATGNVKAFQVGISIIMLLEIPAAYVLLSNNVCPYYALMPAIATNIIGFFYRVYLLKQYVSEYSYKLFFFDVFMRCTMVVGASYFACYMINEMFSINFLTFCISSLISVAISSIVICFFGLNRIERRSFLNMIKSRVLSK